MYKGEKMLIDSFEIAPLMTGEAIFDSHAHYDDQSFDADRDRLFAQLREYGVCGIINNGSSFELCKKGLEIAEKHDFFYQAVGIHPEFAADATDEQLGEIEQMLGHEKVVAVGEIGLDYHYDNGPSKEVQHVLFRRQIELALKHDLPIIVHDRDAHGDTFDILKEYKPKGVVHCYSGSVETMREIVKLGMYIGMTGVITFKNARKAVECIAELPLDRLLIETDCPYLAPVPYRGKRCNSSMISLTAEKIAEIKGVPRSEILKATRENANRLFGLNL